MNIRRGLPWTLTTVLCVVLTGCYSPSGSQNSSQLSLSPLQTSATQTRTYDKQNSKEALKTVLNVLQDEGYLIDYGQADLGLLHGTKSAGGYGAPSYGTVTTLEATVNISEFGDHLKIRINLQSRIVDRYGYLMVATTITDPLTYQDFFTKLERAFFIQKQGL
jgi:hypothetical protein